MTLPDGLHTLRAAGAEAFAAPEVEAWVRATLAQGERLWEAARRRADLQLEGRGPVPVVRTERGRWVVRRYHRGGRVAAPLLGDRYLRLGTARPLRETLASAEARRRGIATPRVMAGAVYAAGPFYRADLVTEYVASASDLAHALFRDERGEEARARILRVVGALVARAASAGIEHADLNAKNVLLDWAAGTDPAPLLLDLDRCRVLPAGAAAHPARMLERLARSLVRHGHRAGRAPELLAHDRAALLAGAGLGTGLGPGEGA